MAEVRRVQTDGVLVHSGQCKEFRHLAYVNDNRPLRFEYRTVKAIVLNGCSGSGAVPRRWPKLPFRQSIASTAATCATPVIGFGQRHRQQWPTSRPTTGHSPSPL